jgi:hypothetical protein
VIDIIEASALPTRHLSLTFENGLKAEICMDQIVKNYSGVFAPLLDDEYFKLVKVDPELGTIVWPNGADACPDTLYLAATGSAGKA